MRQRCATVIRLDPLNTDARALLDAVDLSAEEPPETPRRPVTAYHEVGAPVPGWASARNGALVLAGVVGVVVLGFLAYLGWSANHGGDSGVNIAALPTAKPQETVFLGQTFAADKDGWQITVSNPTTKGAWPTGLLGFPTIARGVYLLLEVDLFNSGKTAQALGQNRFKLHDVDGRTFEAAAMQDRLTLADLSFGQDVVPGTTLRAYLLFDVPMEAAGLWLDTVGGGHIVLGRMSSGSFVAAPGSPGVARSSAPPSTPMIPSVPASSAAFPGQTQQGEPPTALAATSVDANADPMRVVLTNTGKALSAGQIIAALVSVSGRNGTVSRSASFELQSKLATGEAVTMTIPQPGPGSGDVVITVDGRLVLRFTVLIFDPAAQVPAASSAPANLVPASIDTTSDPLRIVLANAGAALAAGRVIALRITVGENGLSQSRVASMVIESALAPGGEVLLLVARPGFGVGQIEVTVDGVLTARFPVTIFDPRPQPPSSGAATGR